MLLIELDKKQYKQQCDILLSINRNNKKIKQGMPCLMKIITSEGDQVIKFDELFTSYDEDFSISFKLP